MLEILMPAVWAGLALYTAWYITSAKDYAPLTHEEAELLWKIHIINTGCKAKRWREIHRRGKTVGFECECGHRYVQKRPIV